MQWKLEREESYFKIYDENKHTAGYFDPEYGDIYPEHKINEIIEEMHQKHETIPGGYLMVPMIKFEVFNDQEVGLDYLQRHIDDIKERVAKWKDFILNQKNSDHKIQVSHTDAYMLSITFPIHFVAPVSLEKKLLLAELEITLNSLHEKGLL
ncbi:MAG TPA: hypothetical protein VLA53_03590 [Nitrosopumilaceae archaeon]|nr:hypothetical protein [Nitrosopumilaceae archaeon]